MSNGKIIQQRIKRREISIDQLVTTCPIPVDNVMDLLKTNATASCGSKLRKCRRVCECIILFKLVNKKTYSQLQRENYHPLLQVSLCEKLVCRVRIALWRRTSEDLGSVFRIKRPKGTGQSRLRELVSRKRIFNAD